MFHNVKSVSLTLEETIKNKTRNCDWTITKYLVSLQTADKSAMSKTLEKAADVMNQWEFVTQLCMLRGDHAPDNATRKKALGRLAKYGTKEHLEILCTQEANKLTQVLAML